MTILCMSLDNVIPAALKGKYVLTFKPGIGNLWLDIDDIFLVLEASISPTQNSIIFEAIERTDLPMFFERGQYVFRENSNAGSRQPWKFRRRRAIEPILVCDTIEEVLQVRNRDLERTEARKKAISDVEKSVGFGMMKAGQSFEI